MAENLLSKFNLDGTEMSIADTKARADASNAVSIANNAMTTAVKKALITYDNSTQTMIITHGGGK